MPYRASGATFSVPPVELAGGACAVVAAEVCGEVSDAVPADTVADGPADAPSEVRPAGTPVTAAPSRISTCPAGREDSEVADVPNSLAMVCAPAATPGP